MSKPTFSPFIRAWTDRVRTRGLDALWDTMSDNERATFRTFALNMDNIAKLEESNRWQQSTDEYRKLGENTPEFADIAVERAGWIVSEKINKAIRHYNNGVRALELRSYQKAIQSFDLAIHVNPFMERAHYNLGMTHKMMYLGDAESYPDSRLAAIEVFKRIGEQFPGHTKSAAQIQQLENI